MTRSIVLSLSCGLVLLASTANAQVETVPVNHPVYIFLKRMEVRGIIDRYHDAVRPIGRRDVAEFLTTIHSKKQELSLSEEGLLADYLREFQYDRLKSTKDFHSVIATSNSPESGGLGGIFEEREKYLYFLAEPKISFFANALATIDMRRISGDALGRSRAEYFQFGGRFRGTMFDKLGFSLEGTNAQFWGSRDLLLRDKAIAQTHTIRVTDAQNFDMSEGYVRFDPGIVSVQLGRERILWGNSSDDQMIISDNSRTFDFIRFDARYKSMKYTFMHGWLLGNASYIQFQVGSDTTARFSEPTIADKYIAAHRIEFSFRKLFDIGFQEMAIYSNRSVDLAYLNPFVIIESAQRARGERDNVFWAFDIQTHFTPGLELSATFLLDDIHFMNFFDQNWYNRYAYQAGVMLTSPYVFQNTSLSVEYTRVEPYVYAHDRSRDNSYSNFGSLIGSRIGPNADAWTFKADWFVSRNFYAALLVSFERHGRNVSDASGTVIRNVGGDFKLGHRSTDPLEKVFLDGALFRTKRVRLFATYQIINQMWVEGSYEFESGEDALKGSTERNHLMGLRLRTEF